MRGIVTLAILAALPLGLAMAAGPRAAFAAPQDGNWSVLVITEQGTCDRGYRYSVNVANGRVVYQGDAAVSLNGTVAPNGAVKVSIKGGDKDASGTGRLSANTVQAPGAAAVRPALVPAAGKPSGAKPVLYS